MSENVCPNCESSSVLTGKLVNGEWDFYLSPDNRKRGLLGFESCVSNPKLAQRCFFCGNCGCFWGWAEDIEKAKRKLSKIMPGHSDNK